MAALLLPPFLPPNGGARAFDQSKYPDLKGQWLRIGSPRWDDNHAPLTPEYQAIFQANLKDMAGRRAGRRSDLYVPLARHAAHHERL